MNHNNHQHIKSYNSNSNSNKKKNRIKFSSSRQRSKKASADVYRSYKRKTGAASREERVHHPELFQNTHESLQLQQQQKKKKRKNLTTTNIDTHNGQGYNHDGSTMAIVKFHTPKIDDDDDHDINMDVDNMDMDMDIVGLDTKTTFAMELDLSRSRNASQLFSKLYYELAPLVKSLPETLHHADKIIHLLLSYIASPQSDPDQPSPISSWKKRKNNIDNDNNNINNDEDNDNKKSNGNRNIFIVNLVTMDVLHLLAVLARDLRHEIHPFLHSLILPRIIQDLINPPTFIGGTATGNNESEMDMVNDDDDDNNNIENEDDKNNESDKDGNHIDDNIEMIQNEDTNDVVQTKRKNQATNNAPQLNLDISIIEAAFRTISYILKYDSQEIVNETVTSYTISTDSDDTQGCLEMMRRHYGATLAHKHETVRRLAAETFAPIVRKLRSNSARKKHIRRVIKSLATSAVLSLDNDLRDVQSFPSSTLTDLIHPKLQRARDDAINGVALLLFYIVRGVPGRIHSKGSAFIKIIINCLSLIENKGSKDDNSDRVQSSSERKLLLERYRAEVIYLVISKFIYNIRGYIQTSTNFSSVWVELYSFSDGIIKNKAKDQLQLNMLNYVIKLVNESVSHGHGRLLKSEDNLINDENAKNLSKFLQNILGQNIYGQTTRDEQMAILKTVCSAWKVFPDHPSFTSRLCQFINCITHFEVVTKIENDQHWDPLQILSDNLLPSIPKDLAVKRIIPAILGTVANRSKSDDGLSPIRLLHTIATYNLRIDHANTEKYRDFIDNDDVFYVDDEYPIVVTADEKKHLLDYCLRHRLDLIDNETLEDQCAQMCMVIKCIPLLTLLDTKDGSIEDSVSTNKNICNWILENLKALSMSDSKQVDLVSSSITVLRSLLLEAIAEIIACHKKRQGINHGEYIDVYIKKSKSYANDLLFEAPTSIVTMKAVSKIAQLLHSSESVLNKKENEVFELLNKNLSSSSHFLRLHTLRLLNTYPQRPYVINHSDLDLTDDLEEETGFVPSNGDDAPRSTSGLKGNCNLLQTLIEIESSKIDLANERNLSSKINRIEILGRTGQLPVFYAEAASYHMLGLMHIKYQPLWKLAVKAIIALASTHEIAVWGSIERQLRLVMTKSFFIEVVQIGKVSSDENESMSFKAFVRNQFEALTKWDKTVGNESMLFHDQILIAQLRGRVCYHQTTDKITVFENVWKVLEGLPQLTTKKSRVIVPIFLQFLHNQYYVYHDDDPDLREFALQNYLDGEETGDEKITWSKDNLRRGSLQTKLNSFLRMFTEVKGMQQLYKHKLLFAIFVSLLSNPDVAVAQMALSCVKNYKNVYVTPYQEQLEGMLSRSHFRETLTKFDLSHQGGTIDHDHRELLLPLIIRILYGRLSARGSGGKSSKDSPAVRRAAILSFLSSLSQREDDISYFVYMMVRSFIPSSIDMQIVDCGHHCREHLVLMIQKATSNDVGRIHLRRQEGFLNLMADVVKKLGFGIINFVPTFFDLILTIIENCGKQRNAESNSTLTEKTSGDTENKYFHKNYSKIRSLCHLRMAELMAKFASTFDFDRYKFRLWAALHPGLLNLASSVVNADKPPSLLHLLVTMSSQPNLIELLVDQNDAVKAVFYCLSVQSKAKTVECTLQFVENLLNEGRCIESDRSIDTREHKSGTKLVIDHLELLIGQFTKRLESGSKIMNEDKLFENKIHISNKLLSQELRILCCISELLVQRKSNIISESTKEDVIMMESLCKLLMPFLDFNTHKESNQWDVLSILKSVLPRIRKINALSHLQSFANLLGPNKANIGISSLETRQKIIACIEAIHEHENNHVMNCLQRVTRALSDLAASHPRHIDECNFDKVLPILNGLGSGSEGDKTWKYYAQDEKTEDLKVGYDHVRTISPLIFYCLNMLYDQDGVISRGAFKALRVLIHTVKTELDSETDVCRRWLRLIESTLVPRILTGLRTKHLGVRRSFILLLSEVSSQFKLQKSPHLYGDLNKLIHKDDENIDFFKNVTHIQLHRRARALNRLRKSLHDPSFTHETSHFSVQSISNVLVPIAMHPILDFDKTNDDSYALEAIATIGSLLKLLPWGKYQGILWKALLDFPKFEKQERYFVAMLCSMIDAFHFDLHHDQENSCHSHRSPQPNNQGIWKQMKSRIIPKIESYLEKDKVEKGGRKGKSLRAPIILALAKLFKKMPKDVFETKLSRLLTVICNALTDRDSNERELARNTMSNLADFIGVEYLSDIIRESVIALSEGYKLHVRVATIHSVLLSLSKSYKRPEDNSKPLPFDKCLPALIDVIQQDIFGQASEIKEVESVNKRLVKEAMGAKSYSCLEIISKMILFKPSLHNGGNFKLDNSMNFSSVHLLVHPFLQRIRDPEIDTKTLGKVKECLNRIAIGISQNTSTTTIELLPFVFATVSPFIVNTSENSRDDSDVSDDDTGHGLEITRTKGKSDKNSNDVLSQKKQAKSVFEWAPSQLKGAKSSKSAYEMKLEQKSELKKVQDGVNAPKLTGTSRNEALKSNLRDFNDPATSSAVSFALTLLHSHFKKAKLHGNEMMVNPFVKILTQCIRYSKDTSAILLSLKCLQVILRLDLPSTTRYKSILASHTLRILSMSTQNTSDETVQSCFKTLTLLIPKSRNEAIKYLEGSNDDLLDLKKASGVTQSNQKKQLTLSDKQMQVLISLLKAAIIDTEQRNATFSVIKAITSTQYISLEYYDLMEDMLKMTVQSQQLSVRQQAAKIFMQYLIEYPMGKQRIENHLKQIVLNAKYEFESGRVSALELVHAVILKLPIPLLEEYTNIFFLPLVLQLVNDESKECREIAAKCIVALLKRLSNQMLLSLHEYAERWSSVDGEGGRQLRRTAVQLFGIFMDARVDFMKKGNRIEKVIAYLQTCVENEFASLPDYTSVLSGMQWEMTYFCLQTLEKISKTSPQLVRKDVTLWEYVIKCLVHPHPWVKLISSRIIYDQFSNENADKYTSLTTSNASSIILRIPGSLFDIVRNLCFQLNSEEDQITEETSTMAIRNLTWAIKVIERHPHLCVKENENQDDFDETDDDSITQCNEGLNPVTWLVRRLAGIAKKNGSTRRERIFKCFAAFASVCSVETTASHLELMLEPLNRVLAEIAHKEANSAKKRKLDSDTVSAADLPKEVMLLMENVCGTDRYMAALSNVKSKAREKREARKQELAAEAVHNPEAAAQRKIIKQQKEKLRRKRRIQEQKINRGVFTKKPRNIVS